MIDVQIEGGDSDLSQLIASTLHGHAVPEPGSSVAEAGKFVREVQEDEEVRRPSREQIETVNFALIDDDMDWQDV